MRNKSFISFIFIVAVGALCLCQTASAIITIDDFDTYSNGALIGQDGWTTTPGFSSAGIDVIDGASPISSPKVAQFDDDTSSSLGARHAAGPGGVGQEGVGTLLWYARQGTNNLANTSGFFLRLNSDVSTSVVTVDPFFEVGFSPANGGISWNTFGGGANGSVASSVSTGTWYRFYLDYDISHTALGNTNRVHLLVTDAALTTTVVDTLLTFPNQNGSRTFFSAFDVLTGSSHDHSMFELDSIAVPEPSSAALMLAAAGLVGMRLRRRS